MAQIMQKRSILPQEEIGYLVNIFVLAQAVLLALVILLLPLVKVRSLGTDARRIPKIMVYFACLGLGFLFIEIALIERFSLFLNSATASFSIVLAGMLVFSGAGSWFSSRFVDKPGKGIKIAVGLIALSVIGYIIFLFPMIQSLSALPLALKAGVVLLVIAPVVVRARHAVSSRSFDHAGTAYRIAASLGVCDQRSFLRDCFSCSQHRFHFKRLYGAFRSCNCSVCACVYLFPCKEKLTFYKSIPYGSSGAECFFPSLRMS